jgi:hypothetical protein
LVPGVLSACCKEYENRFVTYLPASTAQVCRTTTTSNTPLSQLDSNNLGSANSPREEITIQNQLYIGQQIILSDEVTASIVKMAENGDISLLSHLCKTYRTTLNSASSQNLIYQLKLQVPMRYLYYSRIRTC